MSRHQITGQEETRMDEGDEADDDLPPILAPPSTGYLHTVDANQPPPRLIPADDDEIEDDDLSLAKKGIPEGEDLENEIIDLRDSEDEGSTTTDSDDELVQPDYFRNPPEGFKTALRKYEFVKRKCNWAFTVRRFYKSQPTRVRRILKPHKDAEGNPVEEPVEFLFEKIHAEKERMRKAQNIKCERGEDPDQDVGPASVLKFKVTGDETELTQVVYPGNVVNNDKAVATLGGMGTISKIFNQPNKKLVLKFRPNEPYTNGVNGQGRSTCGLLLRVRRRKNFGLSSTSSFEQQEKSNEGKINLDDLGDEPASAESVHDILFNSELRKMAKEHTSVKINGKEYHQQDLMLEDQITIEGKLKEEKTKMSWSGSSKSQLTDCNLKVPKILETIPDQRHSVEVLGVVHRAYDFTGICDFQYLPARKDSEGKLISVKDKIFPIFGASESPEKLVIKKQLDDGGKGETFSLPPTMSRIDNPPRGLMEELVISEKTTRVVQPPDDSVFSNRSKRIIYTISYNFQLADSNFKETPLPVPSKPLALALADIERRQIKKDMVELVRIKFEERPIWSKVALEYATKIPATTLKYIIPQFAYFASNGPWRNTWIKFGVDPRKNAVYSIYQSVDFRLPFVYRRYMESEVDAPPEIAHQFLPDQIPIKAQMFYQLIDIKLDEVKVLIETLKRRAEAGTLVYDDRYGFMKEGTFEYFRYLMTHYLENSLEARDKIQSLGPVTEETKFRIPPGDIEPDGKIKAAPHRRIKLKRIRKTVRKNDNRSLPTSKSKSKSSARKSPSSTLEDLELNKLAEFSDESDGDEVYFEDDDLEEVEEDEDDGDTDD